MYSVGICCDVRLVDRYVYYVELYYVWRVVSMDGQVDEQMNGISS